MKKLLAMLLMVCCIFLMCSCTNDIQVTGMDEESNLNRFWKENGGSIGAVIETEQDVEVRDYI